MKRGNFNQGYIESDYTVEGYYDAYNYDAAALLKNNSFQANRRALYHKTVEGGKTKYRYDFVLTPNLGFLADSMPLLNNCELKLSFDRAPGSTSLLRVKGTDDAPYLEIKDCHAVTEWVSSPEIVEVFEDIEHNPIIYKYDEVEVLCKPLPMHERVIRLDNIKRGNIPKYIFAAIIPTSAINGDVTKSSTCFGCYGVEECNLTLNGHSVNGYPINVHEGSDTNVMYQFNDTIGRLHNNSCGYGMKKSQFQTNFIWAHHFEAKTTNHGLIEMEIKLKNALVSSYSMVVWLIAPSSVSIDKYHNVERKNF